MSLLQRNLLKNLKFRAVRHTLRDLREIERNFREAKIKIFVPT